jgi:hypothetical protein
LPAEIEELDELAERHAVEVGVEEALRARGEVHRVVPVGETEERQAVGSTSS